MSFTCSQVIAAEKSSEELPPECTSNNVSPPPELAPPVGSNNSTLSAMSVCTEKDSTGSSAGSEDHMISEYEIVRQVLYSCRENIVIVLEIFRQVAPLVPSRTFSLPLFLRGEVLPATSSPPHLIVFSTLLCLLSSSSSLPPLLPSSHLS